MSRPVKEESHDDSELMRYRDGDLSREEARAVERRLAASPGDAKKLAALDEIGELVQARYADAERDAAPGLDALWAKLERQLPPPPSRRGVFAALRDWLESYRSHILTGAVAAAAGATIAFFVAHQTKIVYLHGDPDSVTVAAQGRNTEVESLEVPSGSGTIFQIPSDKKGEPATTVIWVQSDDADSAPEGPI